MSLLGKDRVKKIVENLIKSEGIGLEKSIQEITSIYTCNPSDELLQDLAFMVRDCVDTRGKDLDIRVEHIIDHINLKAPFEDISAGFFDGMNFTSDLIIQPNKTNKNGNIYKTDNLKESVEDYSKKISSATLMSRKKIEEDIYGITGISPENIFQHNYENHWVSPNEINYVQPKSLIEFPRELAGFRIGDVFSESRLQYFPETRKFKECAAGENLGPSLVIKSQFSYVDELGKQGVDYIEREALISFEYTLEELILNLLKDVERGEVVSRSFYADNKEQSLFFALESFTRMGKIASRFNRRTSFICICSREFYYNYRSKCSPVDDLRFVDFLPTELINNTEEIIIVSDYEKDAIQLIKEEREEEVRQIGSRSVKIFKTTGLKFFVQKDKLKVLHCKLEKQEN